MVGNEFGPWKFEFKHFTNHSSCYLEQSSSLSLALWEKKLPRGRKAVPTTRVVRGWYVKEVHAQSVGTGLSIQPACAEPG